MRKVMLILILLLVTSLPQGFEVPSCGRAVPEDFCFISDSVSFIKILNCKEVTSCRLRQKR